MQTWHNYMYTAPKTTLETESKAKTNSYKRLGANNTWFTQTLVHMELAKIITLKQSKKI